MPSWKVSHILGSDVWRKGMYDPLEAPAHQKSSASSYHLKYWIQHCSIFIVYTTIFTFSTVLYLSYPVVETGLIYSPARSALVPEIQTYNASKRTPFLGPPSLEADAAWHALITYQNVAVTKEDLHRIHRTSVLLRDGSGYLTGIDVFHEIHCLNYIREYYFSEYYVKEPGSAAGRSQHLYHCIDTLRQTFMCHGDVSIKTFDWIPGQKKPEMNAITTRECYAWEPLMRWTKKNWPSHANGPLLEHPVLGIIHSTPRNKTQA